MNDDPAGTPRKLPFDAGRLARALPLAWGGAGVLVLLVAVLTGARVISTRPVHGQMLAGAYAGASYVVLLAYLRLRALAAGREPRSRRRWVRAAGGAAAWGGFAVWFLLCLDVAASFEYQIGMFLPDWRLNHVWTPHGKRRCADMIAANPEYPDPYVQDYEAHGWLETYDVTPEKPPGTFRIFYLGDSFTQGYVPMDQSVASVVERELNARVAGGAVRIEVVNTGTASYSPILYDVLTRHVLSEFHPDLLVVNVDMTDDWDDWKYERTALYDAEGAPLAVPPREILGDTFVDTAGGATRMTPAGRANLWLLKNTHLPHYLNELRTMFTPDTPVRPAAPVPDAAVGAAAGVRDRLYPRWQWCRDDWDEFTAANVARTFGHLRRLFAWCREKRVVVVVTGVPHHQQYVRDGPADERWSDRPHRELAALARDAGVPYLDSYGALLPQVGGTAQHQFYYRGDMHFNPRGNALWAAAHVKFLLDPSHALLPPAVYAGK